MLVFALAIAPIAALIWFFLHLDRLNAEPVKMLFRTFLFGLLSIIPAIILERMGMTWLGPVDSFGKAWVQAFIVIALAEELAKYFFLRRFIFNNKH